MAGDELAMMMQIIMGEIPDTPEEKLKKIERAIREAHGGRRNYIAKYPKGRHLDLLQVADEQATNRQLSSKLGIHVRRIQQLKRLR